MNAIEVDDLCKTHPGGVEAVRGISFTVAAGEIFGLLGPNGAGKTSTVRILTTQSPATSGVVRVAGASVDEEPHEVRRRLGYVAQASGVDQLASGRENLTLQAKLFHLPRRDIKPRVDEMLDLFDLGAAADRRVSTYSGGMKRRLDVALSLLHRPQVLILDEPTTGLDPESRMVLWKELRRLASTEGLTILVTTHYLEEADQMAQRLAIIDQGQIVAVGTPDELKSSLRGDMIAVQIASQGPISEEPLLKGQEVLTALDEIQQPLVDNSTLYVQASEGARAVPKIVAALEEEGLMVSHISMSRPSLDEVYLTLTGHTFEKSAEVPSV